MRGQRKNPRKAVQPFENKKRKIDIFKNYEANGVEKIQRKLEIFSTLISKKSNIADFKKNLEENCIPFETVEMDESNYEEFLQKRRELISSRLKQYYFSL